MTIVVDSSALIAILEEESEAEHMRRALAAADRAVIAAPTKLELMMVAMGKAGPAGAEVAKALLVNQPVEVVDWSDALAEIAIDGFLRFGKGRHPARLNFGDCMAYALAKSLDAPLLFKGGDFGLTDVRVAL